ncbi:MAG: LysM peptidoglycan-binding domain-containing protein [Campylobacteraceae bacterium]|nr:LysM peptidoglycan-binding domain-containing protein [Campylobacteraceae bacterium]
MKNIIFFCLLIHSTIFASLIGTNVETRDFDVLEDLDIDQSFITDYLLQKQYNSLLAKHNQKRYVRKLNNASLFVPKIKEILRQEGLPSIFIYLAMAESNFTIDAKSNVNARGIWQFMKPTAKRFSLKNDIYLDERMDLVKSTYAASKYLKHLKKRFGKWYLAAIAYNCGEGRVIEAITRATIDMYVKKHGKHNKYSKDIRKYRSTISAYVRKRARFKDINRIYRKVLKWDVKPSIYELLVSQRNISRQYLPKESRNYIRKIIALAMMNNNSFITNEDNAHLLNMGISNTVATVQVKGGLHLKNIAKAIGMSEKELVDLNKHIIRKIVPPYYKSYNIYIPYNILSRYNANKGNIKNTRFAIHIVKRGDSLYAISRKYDIPYRLIVKQNNLNNNRLSLRQKLIIPVLASDVRKYSKKSYKRSKRYYVKNTYKVKNGDTLSHISRLYNISVYKLKKDNKLKTSKINIGDRLVINK